MRVIVAKNTPFDSHMYILANDKNDCVIIDLGGDISIVKDLLQRKNLNLVGVLLTHCHFDHVNGVKSARDMDVDVYISTPDSKLIESSEGTLAQFVGTTYQPIFDYKTFDEGDLIVGDFKFKVILTPGHTKGSCTFIIDNLMFTGDTLFKNNVGRTDLPGGSDLDMKNSINRLIALLIDDIDYKVYPGHGAFTTLKTEAKFNPYILSIKND